MCLRNAQAEEVQLLHVASVKLQDPSTACSWTVANSARTLGCQVVRIKLYLGCCLRWNDPKGWNKNQVSSSIGSLWKLLTGKPRLMASQCNFSPCEALTHTLCAMMNGVTQVITVKQHLLPPDPQWEADAFGSLHILCQVLVWTFTFSEALLDVCWVGLF